MQPVVTFKDSYTHMHTYICMKTRRRTHTHTHGRRTGGLVVVKILPLINLHKVGACQVELRQRVLVVVNCVKAGNSLGPFDLRRPM